MLHVEIAELDEEVPDLVPAGDEPEDDIPDIPVTIITGIYPDIIVSAGFLNH